MQSPESIKLSPPLPWCSPVGLTGFITELFDGSLGIELHASQEKVSDLKTMVISLPPEGEAFHITGYVKKLEQTNLLTFILDNDAHFHALLTKVRKDQHIEICRSQDVESQDRFTGFSRLSFQPKALPELDYDDISAECKFLGRRFGAPILITGMTGGLEKGTEINTRLARAAAAHNIPMGIGSQRLALEDPIHAKVFDVKRHVPDIYLIGNMGGAQLRDKNAADLCKRAVDMINADALAIHLNIIQECLQVEGDRNFSNLLKQLENISRHLEVPLIVKEVGSGVDPGTARKLEESGVSAIDVGGKGGTSWGYIEGLRSSSSQALELAETFRDWGIPTAYSLAAVKKACPHLPVIATGGIRDGVTIAKASGLGASLAGIGLPLLRAALEGEDHAEQLIHTFIRGLKIVMLATGSKTIDQLSQSLVLGLPHQEDFESYADEILGFRLPPQFESGSTSLTP